MRERVAVGLAAAYLGSVAVRWVLADRSLREDPPIPLSVKAGDRAPGQPPEPTVTVLQPILSGDPLLEQMLTENADNHPDAQFQWLVDEDDPEGQRICRAVAAGRPHVRVVVMPPVADGANPKVFKLARALPACRELVAVLDDDTVLPRGSLARAAAGLSHGDLVTGLPCYRPGTTLWSRLVAGFVNGNAAISYLPLARLAPPVTINGMFYLTRRRTLEGLGGFEAIEQRLCDDLEMARLYRQAGRSIVQSTVTHPLATTVPDVSSYLRLQRRWMVFAGRLFAEQPDARTVGLVAVPTVLPLPALVCAIGHPGATAIVGIILCGKAVAMAALRRRHFHTDESVATVLAEVAADLLQPLHATSGFLTRNRIQWRSRTIRLDRGGVSYG